MNYGANILSVSKAISRSYICMPNGKDYAKHYAFCLKLIPTNVCGVHAPSFITPIKD